MNTKTSILLATALALTACETPPTQQQMGTVAGGVIGGVLGAQVGGGTGRTAAIIAGTIAGGLLGSHIGQRMDEADRIKTAQALEQTRTGETMTWRNPDSGDQFNMTPTRTFETINGPCREFTMNATVEGRAELVQGTACRQPDGSWRQTG
jgi:surface antigen